MPTQTSLLRRVCALGAISAVLAFATTSTRAKRRTYDVTRLFGDVPSNPVGTTNDGGHIFEARVPIVEGDTLMIRLQKGQVLYDLGVDGEGRRLSADTCDVADKVPLFECDALGRVEMMACEWVADERFEWEEGTERFLAILDGTKSPDAQNAADCLMIIAESVDERQTTSCRYWTAGYGYFCTATQGELGVNRCNENKEIPGWYVTMSDEDYPRCEAWQDDELARPRPTYKHACDPATGDFDGSPTFDVAPGGNYCCTTWDAC